MRTGDRLVLVGTQTVHLISRGQGLRGLDLDRSEGRPWRSISRISACASPT
jgi:hypothetical protein